MKLSVIVPVFNVAPYLRDCLDSLCVQTFSEWEAVCVDDGSTDSSGAILDEYAAKDHRFRVIHQSNGGVSAARNRAIDAARGDWLGFLDGDDTIERDWFERMIKHASNAVDLVHSDAKAAFGRLVVHGTGGKGSYRTFLRDGWSMLNLVRRDALGGLRYREGMRFKEDVVFFTALALKTNRIAWVAEPGYNYLPREGSAINMPVTDADNVCFMSELSRLRLPREDFAQAVGYDLVLWVKGRDWSSGYDPSTCAVLKFWRDGVASGSLRVSDLRWWWRPAVRCWLKNGRIGLFRLTLALRLTLDTVLGRFR